MARDLEALTKGPEELGVSNRGREWSQGPSGV